MNDDASVSIPERFKPGVFAQGNVPHRSKRIVGDIMVESVGGDGRVRWEWNGKWWVHHSDNLVTPL